MYEESKYDLEAWACTVMEYLKMRASCHFFLAINSIAGQDVM